MLYYANKDSHDSDVLKYKYQDVRFCLKNIMRYSWRKANIRPPLSLKQGLDAKREINEATYITYLKIKKHVIVYIDECSFNASSLPLYTWSQRGKIPDIVIRDTSYRYNAIAAKWNSNVYFWIKNTTSDASAML